MKQREKQQHDFLEEMKISKAKQNEIDKTFNSLQQIVSFLKNKLSWLKKR